MSPVTLSPPFRKTVLTAHVATSVGWLGAVAAFAVLAVAGLTVGDPQTVRACYLAMDAITRFVIVPLALAALVIGTLQSLATPWGLFRHWWVVIKLAVTLAAVAVLLVQTANIGRLADLAGQGPLAAADGHDNRVSLVVHALGGLAVLLVPTALSITKPRGLVRPGRRPPSEGGAR